MDQDCVSFLQWALPRLEMQWSGFRKVRKQVCKRIQRRMQQLEISDWMVYRQFLESNQNEWKILDNFCRITISRFYRDRYLFDYLGDTVIPQIIHTWPNLKQYSCISLGCASGEEPYTIAILWKEKISVKHSDKSLQIIGLDADPVLLRRAREGVFSSSSLRELPESWKKNAFTQENDLFTLKEEYRDKVDLIQVDIRTFTFSGPYHLVCCRNLVATYFTKKLQIEIFQKMRNAMPDGSVLILGGHEELPAEVRGFRQDSRIKQVYWVVG